MRDGWSEEELLSAAKKYAEECRKNKTEKTYIKHAKTFLSESTPFLDYIPKKVEQEKGDYDFFKDWGEDTSHDDDNPYKDWERHK